MNILILRSIKQNSADDIYSKTDYARYDYSKGVNVGNKLWLTGLVSTVSTPENKIDFYRPDMTADYINANYDLCIKPEANIFQPKFIKFMDSHIEKFSGVKIPIYVIACGAQAPLNGRIDDLVEAIKEPASRFIRSVYKTGGEFCLRGYYSKEVFDRLGFSSAVVTGCPSLYQFGRNFHLDMKKSGGKTIKTALNGELKLFGKILKKNDDCVFIDQGLYYPLLFDGQKGATSPLEYVKKFRIDSAALILKHRLKLFIDLQDWADYFIQNQFDMSCGSRIHGNIMSIICGIPALICPLDTRVKEMAEFFCIPTITEDRLRAAEDVSQLYDDMSYDLFNKSFAEKYDYYESFLLERGIVKNAANKNALIHIDPEHVDKQRQDQIMSLVSENTDRNKIIASVAKHKFFLGIYEKARDIYINNL